MPPRPRAAERATLSGHLTTEDENAYLERLRGRYPDWRIERTGAGLVARHRTEEPDARQERAGLRTEVTAEHVELLESRLYVQRALRGDGAHPH
ncbi:hypothetical protein [Nocardiopsis baichengensis]|uniref:hypothetical protein n=1 Tax=Nocardiopsis baichengensis TaxID=280240 RepID=UPI001267DE30|nr:hypothetical protein [Nocardiopsis baichengensis]